MLVVRVALPYLLSITLVIFLAEQVRDGGFTVSQLWPREWPVCAQAEVMVVPPIFFATGCTAPSTNRDHVAISRGASLAAPPLSCRGSHSGSRSRSAFNDLEGFRAVDEALSMRVILDESLLRVEQLESLPDPERWIVNLRVSKMGGILRSFDLAKRAASLGIAGVVGCQVGGNQHSCPGCLAGHALCRRELGC